MPMPVYRSLGESDLPPEAGLPDAGTALTERTAADVEELDSVAQEHAELVAGVRFDLKSLFTLTLVCAGTITIVRQFDFYGIIAAFIGAVVCTGVLRFTFPLRERRFWAEALWGILLPILCALALPALMVLIGGPRTVPPLVLRLFVFVLFEMIAMCASWFAVPHHPPACAFLAGVLAAGAAFAGLIGLILTLPAAACTFMFGLGLPGFTPWFTMFVYCRAAQSCWRISTRVSERSLLAVLGVMSAILVTLLSDVLIAEVLRTLHQADFVRAAYK